MRIVFVFESIPNQMRIDFLKKRNNMVTIQINMVDIQINMVIIQINMVTIQINTVTT